MLCRNGLHELDPDDDWRASDGSRCRECQRNRTRRHAKTDKGRLSGRASSAKYAKTEKGRATKRRYRETDHGHAAEVAYRREYTVSGRNAEGQRLRGRTPEQLQRHREREARSRRSKARKLARKYGLSLRQIESIGLDFYPDVKAALEG
jgi:hypothetical protein